MNFVKLLNHNSLDRIGYFGLEWMKVLFSILRLIIAYSGIDTKWMKADYV
jgi:hypothetical protein